MRRPDYSRLILAAGFLILFFSGGSRFAFGLMLKPMSEDLDVSRSTLSAAFTMFMVVSAVAMPFVGRLVGPLEPARDHSNWRRHRSGGTGDDGAGPVLVAGLHRLWLRLRPRQLRHIHRPCRRHGQPVVRRAPRHRRQSGRVRQRHRPAGHRGRAGLGIGSYWMAGVLHSLGSGQRGDSVAPDPAGGPSRATARGTFPPGFSPAANPHHSR